MNLVLLEGDQPSPRQCRHLIEVLGVDVGRRLRVGRPRGLRFRYPALDDFQGIGVDLLVDGNDVDRLPLRPRSRQAAMRWTFTSWL